MSTLFLRFGIGKGLFAMGTTEIEEILPALVWTAIPHAPRGVVGVFGYRGQHVPLLDLSELISRQAASIRMSTRIVLMRPQPSGKLLGLLAEHVTETFRAAETDFKESGIATASALYLGRIIHRSDEMLQRFDVNRLLESEFPEGLFAIDNGIHN
jgi:chemotaxis-related protein WspB